MIKGLIDEGHIRCIPISPAKIALKALDASATYTLTPLDGALGDIRRLTGAQPWNVELKSAASRAIYEYGKIK